MEKMVRSGKVKARSAAWPETVGVRYLGSQQIVHGGHGEGGGTDVHGGEAAREMMELYVPDFSIEFNPSWLTPALEWGAFATQAIEETGHSFD